MKFRPKNESVFTTGEIAQLCGVTLRTVVNWINRGDLNAYKLPGKRGDNRVTTSNLLAFMQQNGFPVPEVLRAEQAGINEYRGELAESEENRCVLVVDDDVSMAKAIARVIKQAGFEPHIANDGFSAGQKFNEIRPFLMTLDLQMPKMDGFAVLESVKNQHQCKVLVVSAMEEESLNLAIKKGADSVLAKPFENIDLIDEVLQAFQ